MSSLPPPLPREKKQNGGDGAAAVAATTATTTTTKKNDNTLTELLAVGIITVLAVLVLFCLWNFLAAFVTLGSRDPEDEFSYTRNQSLRQGGRDGG